MLTQSLVKLIIFLWRKYNSKLFKNNQSKNQEASEIVRNSRKRDQEAVWKKEEAWTTETSKTCWNAPGILQDFKYKGQERIVTGDEENEAVKVGKWFSRVTG